MDSMISNGQRNTLVEYMILSCADNRPQMLDKDLYDSWKSIMELYMQNKEHGRMILESVEHGPLIWPTIEENGVIRTKKYVELSATEKIQADCDMKATNIILQGLPTELYSLLINDMNIYNMKLEQFQVHTKFLNSLPSEWSKFVTDVKLVKDLHTTNFDQLHAYLQQYELHANEVQTKPLFKTAGSQCNKFREDKGKVILVLVIRVMLLVLEEIMQVDRQGLLNATTVKVKDIWLGNVLSLRPKNAAWFKDEAMLVEAQEAGHILDEEQLAFLADPEVPHSETYLNNDMENQSVHAMQDFEQLFKILICRTTRFNDFICYQNPFHFKKAQRINPTLYDGIVMSNKHVAMPVIDDEETLILEEESRSKMSEKEKDPEAIKKISNKPIDYEKLNRLSKDFRKRFTPQQELSAEQAFWFCISNPNIESSDIPPVKVEVPKELPKVSLVNASLKKLKFHLAQFDSVVKERITHNARTEDILNEITEVQTIFDQMEAAVQQSSVDKQCLEIAKKELLLENDRLLQQIMSQEVLLTVMNSMFLNGESVNVGMQRSESYKSCDNQDALEILEYFEINDLKAQLQDKDTTIYSTHTPIIATTTSLLATRKNTNVVGSASGVSNITPRPVRRPRKFQNTTHMPIIERTPSLLATPQDSNVVSSSSGVLNITSRSPQHKRLCNNKNVPLKSTPRARGRRPKSDILTSTTKTLGNTSTTTSHYVPEQTNIVESSTTVSDISLRRIGHPCKVHIPTRKMPMNNQRLRFHINTPVKFNIGSTFDTHQQKGKSVHMKLSRSINVNDIDDEDEVESQSNPFKGISNEYRDHRDPIFGYESCGALMPPKRTSTSEAPAMTQAAIRKLVADSVTAALEAQAANMVNTDNTTRPREAPVGRKCSYKEFMSCQPINFKSTKGAVGLIRWFERTESMFSRSNCTKDCKKLLIKKYCPRTEVQKMEDEFYHLTVKGNDLKAYMRRFQELETLCPTMVPDSEKMMEVFIGGLPRSIEGNVTASKPQTLEEAINIA
ncbi:retrovirus-related pol polyprotein from transposon TNT 1-94 [Tanacetum coccineum]